MMMNNLREQYIKKYKGNTFRNISSKKYNNTFGPIVDDNNVNISHISHIDDEVITYKFNLNDVMLFIEDGRWIAKLNTLREAKLNRIIND